MRIRGILLSAASAVALLFAQSSQAQQWEKTAAIGKGRINTIAHAGTRVFAATANGGVMRSDDKGATWTAASAGMIGTEITALTREGAGLFAVSYTGGVYLSIDEGTSWSAIRSGLPDSGWFNTFASGGNNLCVGTNNGYGCFRSIDKGVSWTKLSFGESWINVSFFLFSGADLFAASMGSASAVYRSADTGATWNIVKQGGGYKTMIAAGGKLFAANLGVFVSEDNGSTWAAAGTGLPPVTVFTCLTSCPKGILFASSPTAGVFLSDDEGVLWHELNAGLEGVLVSCLKAIGDDLFAGAEDGGIYRRDLPASVAACCSVSPGHGYRRNKGAACVRIVRPRGQAYAGRIYTIRGETLAGSSGERPPDAKPVPEGVWIAE